MTTQDGQNAGRAMLLLKQVVRLILVGDQLDAQFLL
jgi:hypothetical protein